MKRAIRAVIAAAVILAVGVFAAVNSKDSSDDSDRTANTSEDGRKHDDKGGREKADNGKRGEHSPPAWAQRKGPKLDKSQREELREEWKQLSPAERRTLMDELIREHMGAMREWRRCMEAGRDDCELPFPPGLARLR